jgi:thiol-disulfide isomerase/thioredoxin
LRQLIDKPVVHRRALLAGAGAVAATVGAGFAWWQTHLSKMPEVQAVLPGEASPLQALWALELEAPQGGSLKMSSLKGKPLVVNFWATWCPPCVEELPLLDRFYRENVSKNWQVVGLAVDQVKPVQQFLLKMPLSFPVALAGLAGIDVSRSLGNVSGGLPFTVVLNSQGEVALRHMGRLSEAQVAAFLQIG